MILVFAHFNVSDTLMILTSW